MLIKNKYNLTYCSNIFKEKTWKNLLYKLDQYVKNIKKKIKRKNIGLSLCISNSLTNEIKKGNNIQNLITWLRYNKSYISSINGFVYQSFHKKKIKEKIYFPDWSSKRRIIYTKKLIEILSKLIKKKYDGSISTLPVSYDLWTTTNNKHYLLYKASKNIAEIIDILIKIKQLQKKIIHLDIEPEPHCVIETYKNLISFFKHWLLPICNEYLKKKYKYKKTHNLTYIYRHIKICYDICHFSVNFENHQNILELIKKSRMKIGKIQISSALRIILTKENKKAITDQLLILKKSPFLHQVTEKTKNGIKKYLDIKYLLNDFSKKINCELRIHCHIPVYEKNYKNMYTTQNETERTLIILLQHLQIKHMEIETYTHDIMYSNNQIESIIKEYDWVFKILQKINILKL